MKDSYIMHCDYSSHFELLTDEELGRLIRDVNNYVKNGVLPQYFEIDRVLNMAFSFMKTNIDIETKKYIKKCERNKENGSRGGRPKKDEVNTSDKADGFNEKPKKANGFNKKPKKAKKADTDTDTVTDTDTDTVTDTVTDTDTNNNNSVCDKNAHAKNITCHLGSDYKDESCFYCMKKNLCSNKDSPNFKLKHSDETFDSWNLRKEEFRKQLIEDLKSKGKDPDLELLNWDWLNDSEMEE